MTEQPNTTAIRAIVGVPRNHVNRTVIALCDALDACEAALLDRAIDAGDLESRTEAAEVHNRNYLRVITGLVARVEAAEAQLNVYRGHCDHEARAEAAEALLAEEVAARRHWQGEYIKAGYETEAAEARIAEALDSHANHAMHAYSDCTCVGCLMRNALLP